MKIDFTKQIIHFQELDSTNSYAMEFAEEKELNNPVIISTDFQKKGKGQTNNDWESERSKNLLMSLIINLGIKIDKQFDLNVITSLCLIDLLETLNLQEIAIKWPNDILVGTKKIAGILIQNKIFSNDVKYSVVGIGLNINQEIFPDFYRQATSIKNETSKLWNISDVKLNLLSIMEKRYLQYFINRELQFDEYLKYLYRINKSSNFKIDKSIVAGRIKSVDRQGSLILELDRGKRYFHSFEIKMLD